MSFLLTDIRIFDGEQTIPKANILIENGIISKISTSPITHSGPTFSKPNHTLLPGLIDVHVHCDGANEVALPQSLRFGVTTVCDMHNEWPNIQTLRKQREGGDCADLKTTSFAATIENGWPAPIVLMHRSDEQVSACPTYCSRGITGESSLRSGFVSKLGFTVDIGRASDLAETRHGARREAVHPRPGE